MKHAEPVVEVTIEKLVHGGQGLGTLPSGKKIFVWNALPGEVVRVQPKRSKKSYVEGVAIEVLQPSPHRQTPREAHFLATSPWQILPLQFENEAKRDIVAELFTHEHVALPPFAVESVEPEWHYRNKMEYSFYGDDDGLHLALYNRGTHQKIKIEGSVLAMPQIDQAARDAVAQLNTLGVRAADLKSLMLRAEQSGRVVAALFTKLTEFPQLELPPSLDGLVVYHSNPKSPASVPTKKLYELGDNQLRDTLLNTNIAYDVVGFFQVHLPVFEKALEVIRAVVQGAAQTGAQSDAGHTMPWGSEPQSMPRTLVDMYSGVGGIGLSLAERLGPALPVVLVELDPANVAMAQQNAKGHDDVRVVQASTEKALEHITPHSIVVVDPPRAGLHRDVVGTILEQRPPMVAYLSCNPATQARDIGLLQDAYHIQSFAGYNFFPHTPHIETLAILTRK